MSCAPWHWISSLPRTDRRRHPTGQPASWPRGTVRLGSGGAAGAGIGNKAALLDRAAADGIAVPRGLIVLDGTREPDLVDWIGGRRSAVRSAFSAEDRGNESLAGWFETRLGVEADGVDDALEAVRASADRRPGEFRRDVLVMDMVDARHAGVAFSEPGSIDDLVNVTDGLADDLVAGRTEGERLELPRLEQVEGGWPRRLRDLLAGVRRSFGDEPWDVEWADDGATCWLVQLRPITARPRRNETLTAANHAEILPRLPSALMASLIERAGPELFDWYRRRLDGFAPDRQFLHVVAGRPMINLSLLEDMMRYLGLPTRLVASSIGGDGTVARPGAPRRMLRRTPSLIRLGLAQVMAVADAPRRRRRAATIGTAPAGRGTGDSRSTFEAALDDLARAYVTLVTGMFPLSSAIGPPVALLRRTGTLYEHAGRHRTITTDLARRRADLRAGREPLTEFLDDFGHRGIYESDIARPRYADDPSILDRDGTEAQPDLTPSSVAKPGRTFRGLITTPIWWAAAAPITARERLRHEAMRSFFAIRGRLVALAAEAVEHGQLRSVDDLWELDVEEAERLDTGWIPHDEFWPERVQRRRSFDELEVPHVIRLFDDPASWTTTGASSSTSEEGDLRLAGLPLTSGTVHGTAWRLDEPNATIPADLDDGPLVLVARSIDAGWIDVIDRVDAVVVEIGGDLSHGSILVRELGVPAVTNVRGAMGRVATGDPITVDADHGRIVLRTR